MPFTVLYFDFWGFFVPPKADKHFNPEFSGLGAFFFFFFALLRRAITPKVDKFFRGLFFGRSPD